jgi:predicted aconitase
MLLTREDEALLNGEHGEGAEIAMSVLVKLGEMYGADKMLNIENVHIDGAAYGWINDSGLELVEKLCNSGASFRVPATLNPSSIDFDMWKELKVPSWVAEKQFRLANALKKMGAAPTWTCAPYQYGADIRFGQNVAWGESNAVGFANTVVGARTERLGDLADVCSAIVGKYPNFGLYRDENRLGQILFEPSKKDLETFDQTDYGILGFFIGSIAEAKVPVVSGIPRNVTTDQLKSYCAAAAVGGSVGLSHLCGVTPEAKTVADAFHGSRPEERIAIETDQLEHTRQKLSTLKGDGADVICLGCPHCSVQELTRLARLLKGKKVKKDVRLLILTSRAAKTLAAEMGAVETIESSGGKVIADTCWNFVPFEGKTLMTDSAKMAWVSMSRFAEVGIGNMDRCVEAAVRAMR